ncbi:MAG: hypothetical protein QXQ31_07420 [Zestosphaera sp.]
MRSRRCKYDPAQVVRLVLEHSLLYRVCEVVFSSERPLHSSEVGRVVGIGQGYAYNLLKRLERWGVVEVLRDPANGKTMFRPSTKVVARLLAEELRKRRSGELVIIGAGEEEDRDT